MEHCIPFNSQLKSLCVHVLSTLKIVSIEMSEREIRNREIGRERERVVEAFLRISMV